MSSPKRRMIEAIQQTIEAVNAKCGHSRLVFDAARKRGCYHLTDNDTGETTEMEQADELAELYAECRTIAIKVGL